MPVDDPCQALADAWPCAVAALRALVAGCDCLEVVATHNEFGQLLTASLLIVTPALDG